jgi:cytochrome b subunit of formate dehydrogenase
MRERVHNILLSNPSSVEFISGLAWCVLGITLLLPSTIYSNSTGYRVLALIMSENAAGVLFIIFGLLIWAALLFGSLQIRRWSMILCAACFTAFTMFFVLSGPTTGTIYGVFALQSTWAYIRLGKRD